MAKPFQPILQAFNTADTTQAWMADVTQFILATTNVSAVKTAAFTCDMKNYFYPCAPFGGFTITLPPALGIRGKPYAFKNITGSVGNITITAAGTDLIDAAATKVIAPGAATSVIRSDGISKWYTE